MEFRISAPLLLRASLGITFLWFGGLKLADEPTLPASLIAAITPSVDPNLSVPLVGAFEVVLGMGLLIGLWKPLFIGAAALHLSGTLLVLLLRPEVAFNDGNPLLLSVEGEFVVALFLPYESVKATLHTAGVAHHKPGDPTGPASVGAVLYSESGEVLGEVGRSIGVSTNTVADYAALIEGLEMALDKGVREVSVFVDSAVVAGHLVDGYRVRPDHLRPLVEHVRQLLDQFSTWSLTKVPRKLNLESALLALWGVEQS